MSLSLNQYLIKHLNGKPETKFTVQFKKKRRKIRMGSPTIIEGYMSFNLKLTPEIGCPCGKSSKKLYCYHVYHILIHYFQLPIETLILLPKVESIRDYFCSLAGGLASDFEEVSHLMQVYVDDFYQKIKCQICLAPLHEGTSPKQIFICNQCQQICHAACIEGWCKVKNSRKEKEVKGCIFCRDKISEL